MGKSFAFLGRLGKLPSLDLPLSLASNRLVLGDAFLVFESAVNRRVDSASKGLAHALVLLAKSFSNSVYQQLT